MSPSGGSHDTTHPGHFDGNERDYALVRQSLRLTVQGAAIQPHANGCHPASLERVRAAHLPCSPARSNAIAFPHPSRAVRSSLRSMFPRIECSMRLSSCRAMIESLSRGDNDPPSRESGQEDKLSSPETPCEENVGLFSRRLIHQSFFSVRSDDLWVNGCLKQATRPCDSNLFC